MHAAAGTADSPVIGPVFDDFPCDGGKRAGDDYARLGEFPRLARQRASGRETVAIVPPPGRSSAPSLRA